MCRTLIPHTRSWMLDTTSQRRKTKTLLFNFFNIATGGQLSNSIKDLLLKEIQQKWSGKVFIIFPFISAVAILIMVQCHESQFPDNVNNFYKNATWQLEKFPVSSIDALCERQFMDFVWSLSRNCSILTSTVYIFIDGWMMTSLRVYITHRQNLPFNTSELSYNLMFSLQNVAHCIELSNIFN